MSQIPRSPSTPSEVFRWDASPIVPAGPSVLVCDARWPAVPGVCCWREGVTATLRELGRAPSVVTWAPVTAAPVDLPAPAEPLPPGRSGPFPADREAPSAGPEDPSDPALGQRLAGATVVLAEGLPAAVAAARVAGPGCRVWALVLPGERVMPEQPTLWGAQLRETLMQADLTGHPVAGLLTDSEPARDVLERVVSPARPPVVLLPPLARDRVCLRCAGPAEGADARSMPDESGQLAPPDESGQLAPPDESGQLALFRTLLREAARGGVAARPWSFPLSRLVGASGEFADAGRGDWGAAAPASHQLSVDWTAHAQRRALDRVIRAGGERGGAALEAAREVAVVGHDLRFIRELAAHLDGRDGLRIQLDEWIDPSERTPGVSEPLVERAGTLVGEWVRPNAVWLSQVKRPDQFLVLRLHRFELDSKWPARVQIDNVDAAVYISPLMGRRIRDELGWPADKLIYIPNYVDVDWLDRPKYSDARFTLGLPGAIPARKRLDLALDLLAAVRAEDPRFVLSVRTRQPWEHVHTWRRLEQRRFFQRCWERIETDPLLRGAVTWDPYGRDIAAWLRRVGHVLNPSDAEGAPVGVSEGMASAAVPVVRDWPGARDLFGHWICTSTGEAAAFVLAAADEGVWARRAQQARAEARRTFDPNGVSTAWAHLLHGRREQAGAVFGEWVQR